MEKRLSNGDHQQLINQRKEGKSLKDLAVQFNVSVTTAWTYANRRPQSLSGGLNAKISNEVQASH